MKAMDKDRKQRYDTASSLSEDVERFLRLEPVEARAPSHLYRFARFAKRNTVPVLVTLAILLLLIGSIVGMTTAWFQTAASKRQLQPAV